MDMAEIEKQSFKTSARVEVSLEEPGFRGSWYTATVVRTFSTKSRKLFVEFDTLKKDEEGTKPLRESVNVILARPIPPRESPRRGFEFSEEVDAFDKDGWWEGIVTAVHDGGERYSVFFRSSKEQIEFCKADLRLHREWVYGKWVPPSEEDVEMEEGAAQQS